MGKEDAIIAAFPGLSADPDFKITSPQTPDYNCIAWACNINNRWMWPKMPGYAWIDGYSYWPDGVENSEDVASFVRAFEQKGYSVCDSWNFENEYRKIALYVKPGTTECTHAARQLRNGKWTSKLGNLFDIQHGTPYTIEGVCYGVVYCFMRIPFN